MIANLFKNINFLCSKKQRKLLIIFSFLTFLSTLLEMIGLSLIPVSVSTLLKVEEYNSYLPEIFIVQEFFKKDQIEQFMFLSFGIILIFLIKNVFAFSIIYFEGKLFRDIRVDNANKLYDIYVNLPIIEHYSYNVATILKNIATEKKWNHIVINYDGKTTDVFINNILVSTNPGVIPYNDNTQLTSGQLDGIHGGICNVTYFNDNISRGKINTLYNSVNNLNPPII